MLYSAQLPFFSSSSPNPISTISCRAGTKAAASSPSYPAFAPSVPHSSVLESWQCRRPVPWRDVFSWPWSVACQQSSRDHHRAPSVMVRVKRDEARVLLPPYPTDLQLQVPCSVPSFAFSHCCCDISYYSFSSSFHFLLKKRLMN